MKIVMFGDSITDMERKKTCDDVFSYGAGYVMLTAGELYGKDPNKYHVINRGISGSRIVDLYARIKADVWNQKPDVLSILVGINDIWHDVLLAEPNGVDIVRFENMYRLLLKETLERLPSLKIMLLEPFVLKGSATEEKFEFFKQIYDYAKVVKKLAEEFNLTFVPLQEKFSCFAEKNGAEHYLSDGVHPNIAGAKLISEEWLKAFEKIDK